MRIFAFIYEYCYELNHFSYVLSFAERDRGLFSISVSFATIGFLLSFCRGACSLIFPLQESILFSRNIFIWSLISRSSSEWNDMRAILHQGLSHELMFDMRYSSSSNSWLIAIRIAWKTRMLDFGSKLDHLIISTRSSVVWIGLITRRFMIASTINRAFFSSQNL